MQKFKVIVTDTSGAEEEILSEGVIKAKDRESLARLLAKREGYNKRYYKEWLDEDFSWEDLIDEATEEPLMPDAEFIIAIAEDAIAICKEIK